MFRQILERAATNNALVLTFINNLANDLKNDLGSLCDARTFHSYCKKLLHKSPSSGITFSFHFIPYLSLLVEQDAALLSHATAGTDAREFDEAFRTLNHEEGRIDFFLERACFYDAVGFDDSVYRVCMHLDAREDDIPEYFCVLVDEYQDFCELEVNLIGLLSRRSPTVVVGDDDQAVYEFRGASRKYLQEQARDTAAQVFQLPYCARCPDVVVQATNAVVAKAQSRGMLSGRVEKEYICYLPDKHADSIRYPKIVDARCTVQMKKAPYLAKYIEGVLRTIPGEDREEAAKKGYPLGLVIGPKHYLEQIYYALDGRVDGMQLRFASDIEVNILDGYKFLMEDAQSNLGWRIVAGVFAPDSVPVWLKQAAAESKPLTEIIDGSFQKEHLEVVRILVAIQEDRAFAAAEQQLVEGRLGLQVAEIKKRLEPASEVDQEKVPAEVPQLKFTTYPGCKGLSAGFVFVVGMEEGQLPRRNNKPTDTEICQFIVALTRTRKQCHLLSVGRFGGAQCISSIFREYVPSSLRHVIKVDKKFFS